jgi:PAS domain S-box-containing protein
MTLMPRWTLCVWLWRSEQAMPNQMLKPATPQAQVLQQSSAYVRNLLIRVSWVMPAGVLVLLIVIAAVSYQIRAKPRALERAETSQREAADRVATKIEALASSVDRIVLTTRDWAQSGVLTLDDAAALNKVLIPVIMQRSVVSSVHLANDDGREMLLLRAPEGWKNRMTDVPKKGKEQGWIVWKDATTKLSEEKKEQDYDPRKRPWFTGAMGVPENQIYWTPPYIFQTTKEPGITAALRWVDRSTGKQWVVAFDVLLSDLSRVTLEMGYATNGQVALLAADGKVLGLPRAAGFDSEDAIKKAVLQEAGTIGLPLIEQALKEGHEDQSTVLGARIAHDGEVWRVKLQRQALRNQAFQLALLAPESDFAPWSRQVFFNVLISLLVLAVLAALSARRLYRKVAEPVSNLFDQLRESSATLAFESEKAQTLNALSTEMQKAKDFAELGFAVFSGLSGSLAIGQGSLYVADEARQCLVLGAGYARPAGEELPQKIEYGQGLVGQSCIERLPVRMDNPDGAYLQVTSVLGAGSPKSILIQPVLLNGGLLGVLELAVLKELSANDQSLLDSVLPILALCMDILTHNLEAQELLGATRKQASELAAQQQLVAENETRIRELLDMSPSGCSINTTDGVSVFRNARLARLLGYSQEQMIKLTTADYWESLVERDAFVHELKEKRRLEDYRAHFKRSNGDRVTVLLTSSFEQIFGAEHIVTWTYDITSHQGAEVDPGNKG